tara:strand:+ start:1018 stop:1578 length:561 start_codon:yes stop_codon:yes gene_type:complete
MAFLTAEQLLAYGFKALGCNVKISDKVSIYDAGQISIGNNFRVDDFCVISGKVNIGSNVHIAVFCNIAGGEKGVVFDDFSGLAYGCHVFSQSDDYSGETLTNPTVPHKYKKEIKKQTIIGKHVIVGTGSIIFPGVILAEGTAIGAQSMVTKSTDKWCVYFGSPAKKIKRRKKGLLALEKLYLNENN